MQPPANYIKKTAISILAGVGFIVYFYAFVNGIQIIILCSQILKSIITNSISFVSQFRQVFNILCDPCALLCQQSGLLIVILLQNECVTSIQTKYNNKKRLLVFLDTFLVLIHQPLLSMIEKFTIYSAGVPPPPTLLEAKFRCCQSTLLF